MNKEGGIICEGWRDGWRNANANPCVRAAAQCQVSACEWACVTAISWRPEPGCGEVGLEETHKSDNRNVLMTAAAVSKQRRETLKMETTKV